MDPMPALMQMLVKTYMQRKNEHCRVWCWVHKCKFRCRLIFWCVCIDYWCWVWGKGWVWVWIWLWLYCKCRMQMQMLMLRQITSTPLLHPLLCKLQSWSLAESSLSPSLSPTAPLTHWVILFIRMHSNKEGLWDRLTQKFYKVRLNILNVLPLDLNSYLRINNSFLGILKFFN